MAEKKLSGSIALTKLVHVITERKGKEGKTVRGLFIPIEANLLTEKDAAVYMAVNVNYNTERNKYDQNGFISKTTDSSIWKNLDEAGKEEAKKLSPILGNIKDWESNVSSNDNAGAAVSGTVAEDDDLPF